MRVAWNRRNINYIIIAEYYDLRKNIYPRYIFNGVAFIF